jgi:hypothetical protein
MSSLSSFTLFIVYLLSAQTQTTKSSPRFTHYSNLFLEFIFFHNQTDISCRMQWRSRTKEARRHYISPKIYS